MPIDPGDVLQEARDAYKEENYQLSLEKYQWFYDHSIEIKRSYYGVRLSYCLSEWSSLGDDYPPAMEALIALKKRELEKFDSTQSRQAFHEYSSIAGCLNDQKEVFDRFLLVQNENTALAANIFTFVYEYCAENAEWDVCYRYLGDGAKRYSTIIEMFDHMIGVEKKRNNDLGKRILDDAVLAVKRESLWLINMLKECGTREEHEKLMNALKKDLTQRGYGDLYAAICQSTPNNGV